MTDDSRRRIDDRAISRRTALLGLLGGAAGSTVGYERLLGADEPALAETDLELTAEGVTVDSACGRVSEVSVSGDSDVDFEYQNLPSNLADGFELTLEANPHVDERDDHEGWSEPHETEPDNLEDVLANMDGTGTEDDPYQITDDHELQAINANSDSLDAHYELANNIDASETDGWNGDDGFEPIWDPGERAFSGELDGNGHKVCGLTIATDDQGVGLIAASQGSILDIGLVDCSIQVDSDDDVVVGGLTGVNSGTIENAYTHNLTVDIDADDSGSVVGGFVGINDGEIQNSSASGVIDISTGDCIVGGHVAANLTTEGDDVRQGFITTSFSNFDITVEFEDDGSGAIGGFVGLNTAHDEDGDDDPGGIDNAYARGELNVSAETGLFGGEAEIVIGGFVGANFTEDEDPGLIGGLIGLLLGIVGALLGLVLGLVGALLGLLPEDEDREPTEDTPGEIEKSYSAVQTIDVDGDIDDDSPEGAFAGVNEGDDINGAIKDVYWDEDKLPDLEGVAGEDGDVTNVEGLGTNEMQGTDAENNMDDALDFGETWMTIEDPDDYPQLQDNSELPEDSGEPGDEFDAIFENEPIDLPGEPPHDEGTLDLSEIVEDGDLLLENHDAIDGGEDDGTAYRQFEPYPGVERETKIDFKLVLEHVDEDIEATVETTESATVTVRIPGHTDE